MPAIGTGGLGRLVQTTEVLVVGQQPVHARNRSQPPVNIGVKSVRETSDGMARLETIRLSEPDIVILDWEMPLLTNAELMRIARSPGVFRAAEVPFIMLTEHGEHWRAAEAARAASTHS